MKRLGIWLRHGCLVIEWLLGVLWGAVSWIIPRKRRRPVADVYNSFKHPKGIYVFGRVLTERRLIPPSPEDGMWLNFRRMASQWFTREIPKAFIEIHIGGQKFERRSDAEGYFVFHHDELIEVDKVTVCLPGYGYEKDYPLISHYTTPPLVVISDVDDTLMETGAVSLGKMLKTTLFGNSLTRELVDGVSEVIQELNAGGRNPVFYITSSPWNLAHFLKRVFIRAELPMGGLFMTDWGLTPEYWITPSHDKHKRQAIDQVVAWFPDSKYVLLGDDSQMDPDIYAGALRDYPEMVDGIFIRNVSDDIVANRVAKQYAELNKEYGELAFTFSGTQEMRTQMRKIGLLPSGE
ncbi:hypothetical protein Rhal01_00287 [Rubritalea halochordaticola]|uniref:Phosphatidate phosphatase APP1 catalytic domain-containing protein n=1 Tax=Rubritalea halochordaticola TaxID=714537 RepID=A0ABP9UUP9_9BACT